METELSKRGRLRSPQRERSHSLASSDSDPDHIVGDAETSLPQHNPPREQGSANNDQTEDNYPNARSTAAAQTLQRKRIASSKELDTLLRERAQYNNFIADLTERIESLRSGGRTSHKTRTGRGNGKNQEAHGNRAQAASGAAGDDQSGEFSAPEAKRRKLVESEDGDGAEKHAEEAKPSARAALKVPLFQKLLVGTLQRSQKEIEHAKTEKSSLAKAEAERKAVAKLEAEAEAKRLADLANLEDKLKEYKSKLQFLAISISQKQDELDESLWDEHEQFFRGNWVVTKTEPHLFYRFARHDATVERELTESADLRAGIQPAVLVRKSQ